MKNPVRPAPAPPFQANENYRMQRSSTQVNKWEDFTSEDPFFMPDFNRPKSVPPDRPPVKKKAPPRPPPPKFAQKPKPNKPNLLMNLFSRHPSTTQPPVERAVNSTKQPIRPARKETFHSTTTGSLINLNSPPSSPSLTSRSGSDGVSISSFGSDGPVSHMPNNNHSTRFENGFEDDFDFFGGLSHSSVAMPTVKDPWSVAMPQDPFSPPPQPNPPRFVQKPTQVVSKPSVSVKPTIIRAKTVKPLRQSEISGPSRMKSIMDDDHGDWSLPMPSVPPPPLPYEALKEMEISPDVPPRPMSKHMETLKKPYGIALYDYAASHPDDLSFQANDVISLEKAADDEGKWLYGSVGGRYGMFPANFINVMVPLQSETAQANTVTALYAFTPETWEDLEFPEGAEIIVVARVNSDWLYGEYGGKSGQFPAAFVDHIPTDLPHRKG